MTTISKTSSSISQNLMFTTLKELGDYIVITYPIGYNLEVKDNFVHIRKVAKENNEDKTTLKT